MNEYDLLLQWFSSRPHGEARTALVKEACLALNQRAKLAQEVPQHNSWHYLYRDTLYRCGHIEQVGQDKWAVIPPTVLWLGGSGREGEAHVYGARSQALQERLQRAWGSQFIVMSQPHGPALWKWVGTRIEAEVLARSFGSTVYEERGEMFLEALPSLAEAVQRFREGPWPTGDMWEFWQVTPCATRGVGWNWVALPKELWQGVYRTTKNPRIWVYVSPGSPGASWRFYRLDSSKNPDHFLIAQWRELACSGCLRLSYNVSKKTLTMPYISVELPVLVDRSLRLASGTCPHHVHAGNRRSLVFANIGRRRARQAARVLGIPMEITHG